jgi:hypothetical protein
MKFNHFPTEPFAAVNVFFGEKCLNYTPIGFPNVSLKPLYVTNPKELMTFSNVPNISEMKSPNLFKLEYLLV